MAGFGFGKVSGNKKCLDLRSYAPSSEIKVFKVIDGKKTLIRIDPAPLQSIKGDITKW